jgi:hypothetical protein
LRDVVEDVGVRGERRSKSKIRRRKRTGSAISRESTGGKRLHILPRPSIPSPEKREKIRVRERERERAA